LIWLILDLMSFVRMMRRTRQPESKAEILAGEVRPQQKCCVFGRATGYA
jgi:hypothetical protein